MVTGIKLFLGKQIRIVALHPIVVKGTKYDAETIQINTMVKNKNVHNQNHVNNYIN
jgi:hypothetical protein